MARDIKIGCFCELEQLENRCDVGNLCGLSAQIAYRGNVWFRIIAISEQPYAKVIHASRGDNLQKETFARAEYGLYWSIAGANARYYCR